MREGEVISSALMVNAEALASGDPHALAAAAASMAADWFGRCESSVAFRGQFAVVGVVMQTDPQRRALLAAACDLVDLLGKTPQGRQALSDLGFEPFLEHVERE